MRTPLAYRRAVDVLNSFIRFHLSTSFPNSMCVLVSLYSVVIVSNWSFERIGKLKEGRSTIIVSPIKLGNRGIKKMRKQRGWRREKEGERGSDLAIYISGS